VTSQVGSFEIETSLADGGWGGDGERGGWRPSSGGGRVGEV